MEIKLAELLPAKFWRGASAVTVLSLLASACAPVKADPATLLREQLLSSVTLVSCWKSPTVPTIPAPTLSPQIQATHQVIEQERNKIIQSTQTAVATNPATEDRLQKELEGEYAEAVMKMSFFDIGTNNLMNFYAISSGLLITLKTYPVPMANSEEYVVPVWYILASNHSEIGGVTARFNQGADVLVALGNKDQTDHPESHNGVWGKVRSCRKILNGKGQAVAEIYAVEGLASPVEDLAGYDKPYPLGKLGGPCTAENSALAAIENPVVATVNSYTTFFNYPMFYQPGKDQQTGETEDIMWVTGEATNGASGSPVKDQVTDRVCAVINYKDAANSRRVGIMELPHKEVLDPQITTFITETESLIEAKP